MGPANEGTLAPEAPAVSPPGVVAITRATCIRARCPLRDPLQSRVSSTPATAATLEKPLPITRRSLRRPCGTCDQRRHVILGSRWKVDKSRRPECARHRDSPRH